MTEADYRGNVLPAIARLPVRVIAKTIGVSIGYASDVRNGLCIPHRRHWLELASLAVEAKSTGR